MNPVLVIGGCGGLGHHIVRRLLQNGDASQVIVFDLNIQRNRVSGAEYVQGNVASKEDVSNVLQRVKPTVVFHTASPLLMGQRNTHDLYQKVNVEGTRHLIDALRQVQSTKALVYTGTSSVIHNNITNIINATEDLPKCYLPEQTEFYTHTKALAEDIILGANRKDGLLTAVIRGSTLFGEGDNTTIPQMVGNAGTRRSKMQVGDGKNFFDFTYLGNAAHAHILAAKALLKASASSVPTPEAERVDGEVFVVTNDEPWPFWDFVRAVAAAAGHPVARNEVTVVPSWVYYIIAVIMEWVVWISSLGSRESHINRKMVRFFSMARTFDISKAKKRLGYRPEVNIEDAIQRSVDAYLSSISDDFKKQK